MAQQWGPHDISKLKELFLKGFSLKEMAKELSRSVTAVNKAISRFGFREKMPSSYTPIPVSLWQEKKHIDVPQILKRAAFFSHSKRRVVEFDYVVEFLRTRHHLIYVRGDQWYLDHHPVNSQQIILKANQIRVSEDVPIFCMSYLK